MGQFRRLSADQKPRGSFPMHLSKDIYAILILTSPIGSALSALTYVEVTSAIQDLSNRLNDDISDANAVTVTTGNLDTQTLAEKNNVIASYIDGDDEALQGSPALTEAQRETLIETLNQYTGLVAKLSDTLGEKAGDVLIPSDQNEVQKSTDALSKSNDAFLDDLGDLATTLALVSTVDDMRTDDDEADEDMDNDDENSPLRRKLVIRA